MKEFLNFIAGILEIETSKLFLDLKQDDIEQWDSLMHIRLIAELEEAYGVEIPIDDITEIKTIGDFYKLVEGKQ